MIRITIGWLIYWLLTHQYIVISFTSESHILVQFFVHHMQPLWLHVEKVEPHERTVDLSKSQARWARLGYLRVGTIAVPHVHPSHERSPVLCHFDFNACVFAVPIDGDFESLSRRCRVCPIADLLPGPQFDPRPMHSLLARGQDSLSRVVPDRGRCAWENGVDAPGPTICVFS